MKYLQPTEKLTEQQTQSGLNYIVKEGLAAEAMVNLTGGAFLVSMALYLGASNFQIGLLAALPVLTNVFQLLSVWLVQKYENRRAISVITTFVARFALLIIGILPFVFISGLNVQVLIFLLSFHYFFGSISGASWNSWMKDLVPEKMLGTYFSHRTRVIQILSVISNFLVAFFIDFMKSQHPDKLITTYFVMFLIGAGFGMLGLFWLSKAPEPKAKVEKSDLFKSLGKPLKDKNFRKLLVFNSFWAFSLNLAIPFFSVFMMRTIGLPLSYIIAFTMIGQISSIFSVKMWGMFTDRFSNKTIINICAPIYIVSILAMAFTALPTVQLLSVVMLVVINILSGFSTAGINLAIGNMGMKLAPREEAMAYISVKNIIVSLCSALAPLLGGFLADFFAAQQEAWNFKWDLSYFFVLGAVLAMLSLRTLKSVNEKGEVQKSKVVTYMGLKLRAQLRDNVALRGIRTYRPGLITVSVMKRVKTMF
jgi:MFS family permease